VAAASHWPANARCGRPGCRCPVHALPLPPTSRFGFAPSVPGRPGTRPRPARPACGRNRDT